MLRRHGLGPLLSTVTITASHEMGPDRGQDRLYEASAVLGVELLYPDAKGIPATASSPPSGRCLFSGETAHGFEEYGALGSDKRPLRLWLWPWL